jgi:GntR family transcriptional regulator/MocR family aminotransferase
MDLIFELPVEIGADSERSSTHSVYNLLKRAILEGHLPAGSKLPPTRLAGRHFRLSRNSMVSIYDRLTSEGLVTSRRGSGTFVARRTHPSAATQDQRFARSVYASAIRPLWSSAGVEEALQFWDDLPTNHRANDAIELRTGLGDTSLFPYDEFRRCMARTLRAMERAAPSTRSAHGNQGGSELRRAISDHVRLMRTLVCDPDDIIVTSGAQQAVDLLARVFVEPGQTVVAIEEPNYPPFLGIFRAAGAIIQPVPVDRDGMIVDKIPKDAKLVLVCPSNQYPLGVTMSVERRRQLYQFAKERHALIVEDDYDGEFRTAGEPLKAIYSQEASEQVFYLGTFSKCMIPTIRLGYLIAPAWAREALVLAKNCTDWNSSPIIQRATARFISEGYLSAHVARMRAVYRDRRAHVVRALAANFGSTLRPVVSNYGLHLTASGDPNIDWDAIAWEAGENGVSVHALTRYYMDEPLPGLLFGLGSESKERLVIAVERLAAIARNEGATLQVRF